MPSLFTQDSLYHPGFLTLDHSGNLWVSDHSLESRGNNRLLEFDNSLFPLNSSNVIFEPNATRIMLQNCGAWETAFDSQGHMAVGFDAYNDLCPHPLGTIYPKDMNASPRWPGIYLNPLAQNTTPDLFLNDFYSSQFSLAFDRNDNLYVGDINRSRVLIYLNPLNDPPPTITYYLYLPLILK